MEPQNNNEIPLSALLEQFMGKINELNQDNTVWLAIQDKNPLKKQFIDSVQDIHRQAINLHYEYPNLDLANISPTIIPELAKTLNSIEERVKEIIKLGAELLNYYNGRKNTGAERDLDATGEYFKSLQSYLYAIRTYKSNLANLREQNPSSQSNQYYQSSIPPVKNKVPAENDIPPPTPLADTKKVEALQTLVKNFSRDINLIITENIGWYSTTIDEEDAKLGAAISAALENAKALGEVNFSLSMQASPPLDPETHAVSELNIFTPKVAAIISICQNLFSHYQTIVTGPKYEEDIKPLTSFSQKSEEYLTALEQFKTIFASGGVLTEDILRLTGQTPVVVAPEDILTRFNSDVPSAEIEDSLNITPDVNALASIITYTKVTPPLAIGLFGNWGSGKSFFMKKLRKQIDVFAKDEGDEYVDRVVHIEFNSWHYSDSNLWASFVTKIFDDLNAYGTSHPNSIESLFKQLNSTSEFLNDATLQLSSIQSTITKLETELQDKKTEIATKAQQLSGIKLTDVAIKVLKDPIVTEKLEKVKKQLPQRQLENLSDIRRSIKELDGFVNKFIETVKLLLSFKSWKSWVALALFIIICSSPYWLPKFFNVQITDFFDWFGKYSPQVAIVLANLAGIASYATIGLNKVQETLKSVAGDCAELEKEAIAQHQVEVDKIQAELDMQKEAHIQKEAEINKLKKDQAEVQATIDDIRSGRKLVNFIATRVTDQRYIESLGLISWIRKDFQILDDLLKKQRKLNNLKKLAKADKEKTFQIDRIILYIDDLDRCNEDVVVKVLEAIHLLLAFELFVVVVGVDPRWMHNALENKYSKQLKKHKEKKDAENNTSNGIDSATSYDYLEKIFQIPLSLNEIDPAGKAKLIDEALKEKVETEEEHKPKPDPKIEPDNKGVADTEKQDTVTPASPPEPDPNTELLKKKQEEKEANEKAIRQAKQTLVLTDPEVIFMKAICDLVGNTPRAVNRYINIYRILRSHRNLKVSETPIQDYCAVMILLGIVTGLPNESEEFFKSLAKEKTGFFESFVGKQGNEFKALKDACNVTFKIPGQSDKSVGMLEILFMKQKFELVQRFSFRSYGENEIVTVVSEDGIKMVSKKEKVQA